MRQSISVREDIWTHRVLHYWPWSQQPCISVSFVNWAEALLDLIPCAGVGITSTIGICLPVVPWTAAFLLIWWDPAWQALKETVGPDTSSSPLSLLWLPSINVHMTVRLTFRVKWEHSSDTAGTLAHVCQGSLLLPVLHAALVGFRRPATLLVWLLPLCVCHAWALWDEGFPSARGKPLGPHGVRGEGKKAARQSSWAFWDSSEQYSLVC